jgi:glycosyltransferase involved in cell wall biosynthesis
MAGAWRCATGDVTLPAPMPDAPPVSNAAAMVAPAVAMVLPPREGFAAGATGAIGLLLQRLASWPGQYTQLVIGMDLQARSFPGIEFHAAAPSWFPGTLARRYAGGVLHQLRRLRPALVEVHNRPEVALFLARRCPELPVSLFLHNDPQGMRHASSVAQRTRLLRSLARVVAVSGFIRDRLHDGVAEADRRGLVLANCLDLRSIPPSAIERDRVLLFAGRVVADKGADSFVQACALALQQLPGWRAAMIGADRFGPDSPDTAFLRRLRPLAEAAGVSMLGYRPHADVLAAMARAAVVVVPSRWDEPFGLTALEALACGAALAYAPRGGLPELAGAAGLPIDPDNPASMAAALVALCTEPARMAELGRLGRARAACFDLPQTAAALDALRSDILDAWRLRHPGTWRLRRPGTWRLGRFRPI